MQLLLLSLLTHTYVIFALCQLTIKIGPLEIFPLLYAFINYRCMCLDFNSCVMSNNVCMCVHVLCILCALAIYRIAGNFRGRKLSRISRFERPSAKVFSAKFGGVPHPLMIGFKQSVKVFSAKFSLPTDPRKFSPSKVYRYTVCAFESFISVHTVGGMPTCTWLTLNEYDYLSNVARVKQKHYHMTLSQLAT